LADLSEVDSDRELNRRAQEWIRSDPAGFAAIIPKKIIKFFSPVAMETGGSPIGKWEIPVNLAYAVFLIVVVWGAIKNYQNRLGFMLLALTVWYMMIALIFYGGTRVALPIAPGLVILAATGVEDLLRRKNRS
jgi:hypothetical protein